MSGCAELTELRNLNRRQAITIRDQSDEIARLKREFSSVSDKLKSSEEEMNKLRSLPNLLAVVFPCGIPLKVLFPFPEKYYLIQVWL